MLKRIYRFFKKEPRYFLFCLFILSFFAFYHFSVRPPAKNPKASAVVKETAYQTVEKGWREKMNREDVFLELAKKKPLLVMCFQIMTLFFFLAVLAGCVLNALFVWKSSLRVKFSNAVDPPSSSKKWPLSMLFKVVVLFMVWGIALSIGMGFFQAVFPKWASNNYYMVMHTLLLDILCLFFMVKFVRRAGGQWRDLGFHGVGLNNLAQEMKMGLLSYLGVLPLFAIMVVILFGLANLFHYEPPPHPLVNVFVEEEQRAPFLMIASILLGTVLGPVIEEVFFRGFCYPIFKNQWGKLWAMILSAAFFAGIHYSGFVFWPILVLGISLAYVYEKRRSLVASITLHVTHNTLFITYFFLVKQMMGA